MATRLTNMTHMKSRMKTTTMMTMMMVMFGYTSTVTTKSTIACVYRDRGETYTFLSQMMIKWKTCQLNWTFHIGQRHWAWRLTNSREQLLRSIKYFITHTNAEMNLTKKTFQSYFYGIRAENYYHKFPNSCCKTRHSKSSSYLR